MHSTKQQVILHFFTITKFNLQKITTLKLDMKQVPALQIYNKL